MTASPVSTAAAAHADNAAVVPALPTAGVQLKDTYVLICSIRNTAATVTAPSGWNLVYTNGGTHFRVYARENDGSVTAPTVTPSGGAAGDTVSAFVTCLRGVHPSALAISAGSTNVSAQNIAYPTVLPPRNGSLVMVVGWKRDDWTGVATLAGMTELAEPSSTLGNDQGLVADVVVQTTAASVAAGSFVVTGGVAEISKGAVLVFNARPDIVVTEQDSWPPRTLVTVSGLTAGDQLTLYRQTGTTLTAVRGGTVVATDTAYVVVDAEIPFGTPVSYVAVINNTVTTTTSSVTYTLPGGKVALSDAISGEAVEVMVGKWPSREFDPQSSVFKVGGRNVVISSDLGMWEADIEIVTIDTAGSEALESLLRNATAGVLQLRQPGGYWDFDCYVAVTSYRRTLFNEDWTDPKRKHLLHVVQVEAWATTLLARGFTYGDMTDAYTGLTYANLAADFPTYLAVAQGDYS